MNKLGGTGHCEACGQDMPLRALVNFNPEHDVTQFVCRDYEACGARVMNGQTDAALPVHAATRVRKLSDDIRAALKADGPPRRADLEQFGLMVEHVARVLTAYNARDAVVGTSFDSQGFRPSWARERQVAIPTPGAWRGLVHRVSALESWAKNTTEYLGNAQAWATKVAPAADGPTEVMATVGEPVPITDQTCTATFPGTYGCSAGDAPGAAHRCGINWSVVHEGHKCAGCGMNWRES